MKKRKRRLAILRFYRLANVTNPESDRAKCARYALLVYLAEMLLISDVHKNDITIQTRQFISRKMRIVLLDSVRDPGDIIRFYGSLVTYSNYFRGIDYRRRN